MKGRAASFSRKNLDELSEFAAEQGAKGIVSIKVTEEGWQSSLNKFFNEEQKTMITKRLGAIVDDLILIVADQESVVNFTLGKLRLEIADRLKLVSENQHAFLWVVEFPLLEYNEEEGRLEAVHHPFTSPLEEDLPLLTEQPEKARARAYDLVLDGVEIGGGSVRIHDLAVQKKVFQTLGISKEEADLKFGFLLEALKFGAPPHAGMALGFDRLVAIMAGLESIREVIAFPKTQRATCPLTDAPSPVDEEQLRELSIKVLSNPSSTE